MENFNERFERLLRERGIQKSEIAASIGMSRTGMSSWKNSDRIPRADMAIKVAKILDIPVDYLVFGEDYGLKKTDKDLYAKIQELTDSQQEFVESVVDFLRQQNREKGNRKGNKTN